MLKVFVAQAIMTAIKVSVSMMILSVIGMMRKCFSCGCTGRAKRGSLR
jgi:hypothetical protein